MTCAATNVLAAGTPSGLSSSVPHWKPTSWSFKNQTSLSSKNPRERRQRDNGGRREQASGQPHNRVEHCRHGLRCPTTGHRLEHRYRVRADPCASSLSATYPRKRKPSATVTRQSIELWFRVGRGGLRRRTVWRALRERFRDAGNLNDKGRNKNGKGNAHENPHETLLYDKQLD
jgi:hypothetical protein